MLLNKLWCILSYWVFFLSLASTESLSLMSLSWRRCALTNDWYWQSVWLQYLSLLPYVWVCGWCAGETCWELCCSLDCVWCPSSPLRRWPSTGIKITAPSLQSWLCCVIQETNSLNPPPGKVAVTNSCQGGSDLSLAPGLSRDPCLVSAPSLYLTSDPADTSGRHNHDLPPPPPLPSSLACTTRPFTSWSVHSPLDYRQPTVWYYNGVILWRKKFVTSLTCKIYL